MFGPQTWAMVREAYLGGLDARQCERLYGPSVGAIRGRIHREGWTRAAHAEAVENARLGPTPPPPPSPPRYAELAGDIPPPTPQPTAAPGDNSDAGRLDPDAILREAAVAARAALARGRGAEAMATVKAAESLVALCRRLGASTPRGPLGCDAEQTPLVEAAFALACEMAGEIGRELLADDPVGPAIYSRFIYAWRAQNLAPNVAAHDIARARHCGWVNRVWDADGKVRGVQTLTEFEAEGP